MVLTIRIRLYFCVFCLLSLGTSAQRIVQIRENFESVSLANYLDFEVDSFQNQSFESIKKSFKGTPIKNDYPNFDDSPYPHWVRFGVRNKSLNPQKIALVTKGVDSLGVYLTNARAQTLERLVSGSHYRLGLREIPSPFLCVSFELPADSTYWVWTRIRNVHYRLAASPFALYEESEAKTYIFRQHFFHSLFIGSMFLFLLLGLALAYAFKEKIYWYYLGCVVCALCIMLAYNDYLYFFLEPLPTIVLNKNILGIFSATVPVFYLLFAERFLEINPQAFTMTIKVSRIIILTQYIVMFLVVALDQTLFEFKTLFYVFMGVLSSINLIYLVKSWPSSQAKLFIFATLPVTFTVLLETLSNVHRIPVQNIHNAYYFTTFLELIVLTAGLVYRFKQNEEEKYQLENEILNVGFEAQRAERNQISEEMHDDIGASLTAVKYQLNILSQKAPKVHWQELQQNIDAIYIRVRELSHQLRLDDDYQIDSLLIQKYKSIETIDFSFDGLENIRFEAKIKVLLVNIVSEIITNALKHAQCTYINVEISYQEPTLKIIIEDNGIGFNPKVSIENGQGLKTIERRVTRNLKGNCNIDSGPKGTTIIIKVDIYPI
jgi:signal transduction histidine kinase